VANEGLDPLNRDPANRDRSWDRCYSFFRRYYQLAHKERQECRELACLHLGFYLASWGMFRSSGPLIHKDYTICEGLIDLLLGGEYEGLWNADFFEGLLTRDDPILPQNPQVELILDLKEAIRNYFNQLTIIRGPGKPPENATCTDTMVTKILLGTLACTPAYDTYFCRGLARRKIRRCGSFTRGCFINLLNVCREHHLWQALRHHPIQPYEVPYPVMRVVDLYFWCVGRPDT
jgi:hypothetical protein